MASILSHRKDYFSPLEPFLFRYKFFRCAMVFLCTPLYFFTQQKVRITSHLMFCVKRGVKCYMKHVKIFRRRKVVQEIVSFVTKVTFVLRNLSSYAERRSSELSATHAIITVWKVLGIGFH